MGMFDYLIYNGTEYQTKDTPDQALGTYELKDDGLWYKKVEYEWEENASIFGGYLKEISHEWLKLDTFDGIITFYDYIKNPSDGTVYEEEWKVFLMDGNIIKLKRIK